MTHRPLTPDPLQPPGFSRGHRGHRVEKLYMLSGHDEHHCLHKTNYYYLCCFLVKYCSCKFDLYDDSGTQFKFTMKPHSCCSSCLIEYLIFILFTCSKINIPHILTDDWLMLGQSQQPFWSNFGPFHITKPPQKQLNESSCPGCCLQ